MRRSAWLVAAFMLPVAIGTISCRKYAAEPIFRSPAISAVAAVPNTLGPGDSTTITITASDPNGDALVYDWEPYNGLIIQGSTHDWDNFRYNTTSNAMVFHRSPTWPYATDTAFVVCGVRDLKGGGDEALVRIVFTP